MSSRSTAPELTAPAAEATPGTPTAAERSSETVLVGRVRKAHGLRGEVLIESFSDVENRFGRGQELLVRRRDGTAETLRVAQRRGHGAGLLVSFEEVVDRDGAELLAGARLEVERAHIPRPPEDAFYYFELVGCRCIDAEAGELGVVDEVIEDGGGLLLRVASPAGEILVPFVASFLERVDVENRRIDLRLPAGLVEACTSGS